MLTYFHSGNNCDWNFERPVDGNENHAGLEQDHASEGEMKGIGECESRRRRSKRVRRQKGVR